jgi:hypothetical protein
LDPFWEEGSQFNIGTVQDLLEEVSWNRREAPTQYQPALWLFLAGL